MVKIHLIFFKLVSLGFSLLVVLDSSSWCPHNFNQKSFEKKTERFWQFDKDSTTWVEVDLPYDLLSCVNETCNTVAVIDQTPKKEERRYEDDDVHGTEVDKGSADMVLNMRRRVSLTRMSETSIWVTGESGSIYERFWNGVQWVIAPHDLPALAGPAILVFLINQTILALSEAGKLYQLQLTESSQLVWSDLKITYEPSTDSIETESPMQIKTGAVSYNRERAYFSTINGSLLELSEIGNQRLIYHGHPPDGDVVAIADAASITPDVVFTISSTGKLYEFDRNSKPSWKKHIPSKESTQETLLAPAKGCILYNLVGSHSISLFLLTKTGSLVERRLYQRKWKWIVHGGPREHHLTSMTAIVQEELTDKASLFFTTATGFVFEYQLTKHSGLAQSKVKETWVNHKHPLHVKAARGIPALQIQIGKIIFSLDDGRLAELHFPGFGGEASPPSHRINFRKKTAFKYEWSILDAPESEGWNAEYCTEERGPSNCITGMTDGVNGLSATRTTKRRGDQAHKSYLTPSTLHNGPDRPWDQNNYLSNGIRDNFRLRVMQEGTSYFFITDNGSTFEYLYTENMWLWLNHEHSTVMRGLLGSYNGSQFLVDTHGNLHIRERNENGLVWINATALRKGRQVVGGPPWDRLPGKTRKVTAEDALFFVSKSGRLVQFTVALRKFKWKDCNKPPSTKIAYIIDQEMFRDNIVFTVGRNGRLYQYNKVTELWHEHFQSPHLILSSMPGTAMRQSSRSLKGSIFMVTQDGGLVEYQWKALDGWNWVEHGTPYKDITLVGAPGPCLDHNQLFVISSDGEVYLRYMDQETWKWKSHGFPSVKNIVVKDQNVPEAQDINRKNCASGDIMDSLDTNAQYLNDHMEYCDFKVASVRPIPFSDDSLIFELRDGRFAELRRTEDIQWVWWRIIGTPTSPCLAIHWTTLIL